MIAMEPSTGAQRGPLPGTNSARWSQLDTIDELVHQRRPVRARKLSRIDAAGALALYMGYVAPNVTLARNLDDVPCARGREIQLTYKIQLVVSGGQSLSRPRLQLIPRCGHCVCRYQR